MGGVCRSGRGRCGRGGTAHELSGLKGSSRGLLNTCEILKWCHLFIVKFLKYLLINENVYRSISGNQ